MEEDQLLLCGWPCEGTILGAPFTGVRKNGLGFRDGAYRNSSSSICISNFKMFLGYCLWPTYCSKV